MENIQAKVSSHPPPKKNNNNTALPYTYRFMEVRKYVFYNVNQDFDEIMQCTSWEKQIHVKDWKSVLTDGLDVGNRVFPE